MTAGRRLDPSILREYDIRGIVGKTLSADDVEAIGRGFGTVVAEAGGTSVAVGYDGRLHSPELEGALVKGLLATEISVRRVGRGPTPMLYYGAYTLGVDAGVMVTGSHNPPEYNGLKMVLKGRPFYGADIQRLGERIAAGRFQSGQATSSDVAIEATYVNRLLEGHVAGRPMTVAWDPGNGATGDVILALTTRLPGRHLLINETIDGRFPAHHPDPTVESNLSQLKAVVEAERCELGIAFDGDGDRIGVIDGRGRVLWGDQLMMLYARDVLAAVPGATIIADVKASQALFDEIARLGGKPLMWRTGHSVIKAKMAETKAPLAGEMSGHIFFAHRYYGYDDAVYAALRLLELIGQGDADLATLRDSLPSVVNTPELRFACDDSRKLAVIAEVKARLEKMSGVVVNDIDGVRVTGNGGWWLLRSSNTQPVLVARAEAVDATALKHQQAALVEQLKLSGIKPPTFD
ncbi:MAG: phosphomannomutase/phosphoglucomutase [Rhodospirillales bacterium]|nr:phosphomannomutase/phosphoglucomutase [Rhodospirillales bacterium]